MTPSFGTMMMPLRMYYGPSVRSAPFSFTRRTRADAGILVDDDPTQHDVAADADGDVALGARLRLRFVVVAPNSTERSKRVPAPIDARTPTTESEMVASSMKHPSATSTSRRSQPRNRDGGRKRAWV